MKTAKTYLVIGRVALAAAFLIASSGFTVVLHTCLMEDMACCGSMASRSAVQSNSTSGDALLARTPSSCCSNTIVGGLDRTPATIENPLPTVHVKMAPAIAGTVPDRTQPGTGIPFAVWQSTGPPGSPPCGLYLSNAALLI